MKPILMIVSVICLMAAGLNAGSGQASAPGDPAIVQWELWNKANMKQIGGQSAVKVNAKTDALLTRRRVPEDYSTIQSAINAAINGDTVLVRDSTYYENIDFMAKRITVASHFLIDNDTSHISNTIIDGSQPPDTNVGSVVYFVSGEDTNSVLCGFTITGGTGTVIQGPISPNDRAGGGILCFFSGARISRNKIFGNRLTGDVFLAGGGIAVGPPGNSFVIIEGNHIMNNTVVGGSQQVIGGGIVSFCPARVAWNAISRNLCSSSGNVEEGGGLFLSSNVYHVYGNTINNNGLNILSGDGFGSGVLLNTVDPRSAFYNNTVDSNYHSGGTLYSGGVEIFESDIQIFNNIITRNIGTWGGGIRIRRSRPSLVSNTISGNIATGSGGGILLSIATAKVLNTILWGNTGGEISFNSTDDSAWVHYSDVQGGWPSGDGNMNADPLFMTGYLLGSSSPCIGRGVDSLQIGGVWYHAPAFDRGWNTRPSPFGTSPDMGAWEDTNVVQSARHVSGVPATVSLAQNYPNPFNPQTTISFAISHQTFTTLKIFNTLGQEIATLVSGELPPGMHSVQWNAGNAASGVYYYTLQAGGFMQTRKLLLLR